MQLLKVLLLNPVSLWIVTAQFSIRAKATPRFLILFRECFYFLSVLVTIHLLFMFGYMAIETLINFFTTEEFKMPPWFFLLGFMIVFTLAMNKDLINGQGMVNRHLGYRVVDFKTGRTASPLACMLRNLTFIFWPFEFILLQRPAARRIGDYLFGTKLVPVTKTFPETFFTELKDFKWSAEAIAALVLPLIPCIFYLSAIAIPNQVRQFHLV